MRAFTVAGVGKLIRRDKLVNAKKYIIIQEKCFLPCIQQVGIWQNMLFQEENAPTNIVK